MSKFMLYQYKHCTVASHFNQKTPDKTVNKNIWLFWILKVFKNNVVKKLGIYKDAQTVRKSLKPPKKPKKLKY